MTSEGDWILDIVMFQKPDSPIRALHHLALRGCLRAALVTGALWLFAWNQTVPVTAIH